MARRKIQSTSHSAPKRIVRTIRTSNYYLKIVLIAIFIFLLGAASAYRFLQRLPVNNLDTDLHSDQITLSASAQPSIQPEGNLFASPDPTSVPLAVASPVVPTVQPTPSASVKPAAAKPTPKSIPTPLPSPKLVVKSSPALSPVPTTASPVMTPTSTATPTAAGSVYIVKSGDSLWKIAKDAYGDPYQWTKIYAANKKAIGQNPGLVYAGMQLTLPSVK